MNLKDVFNQVKSHYSQLDFNPTFENDKMEVTANIVASKHFDDGIFCRIVLYQSGTLHVFFTFDRLDPTMRAYDLINEFNNASSWACAYISEKKDNVPFLELHYKEFFLANEYAAIDAIELAFDKLLAEQTLKYLKPLTSITR